MMLLTFVSIVMLLGLLVAINHFGTPRYRVNFSPGMREAFRIFLADTYKDMAKLFLSGQPRTLPAKEGLFFNQRFAMIMNVKDGLVRYSVDDRCNTSP